MEEKEKILNETQEQVESMDTDYLEAIKDLKQNSVPKSDYDKLRAENKKLLNAVIDGQTMESGEVKPTYRKADDIRHDLFNKDHNNLEFVKLSLELRNTLIANGEQDPFLPAGAKISPTSEDVEKAQLVADIYQECIDCAEGDPEVFNRELARRTKDVIVRRR